MYNDDNFHNENKNLENENLNTKNLNSKNLKNKHIDYVDISSGRKPPRRKLAWGKIISTVFFTLLGVFGGALIYAYSVLNSFNYKELYEDENQNQTVTDEGDETLINDNMVLNVLLLGSDSQSAGDGGRTDTILLLSLDARHKKLKLTSFMRDTWVKIPGYSLDRLNAAYTHGGAKTTAATIKHNFGIKIDRYALVDFDNFERIVDSIGGIDMELSHSEVNYINKESGDKNLLKGSGKMHLSGKQALMHARNRNSAGSDYDRTERQRNVIMAIFEKGKTLNIGQITKLIATIAPMITTDFKTSEITRLAGNALKYFNFSVEQFRIPTDDNVRNETIDHKMVLVINDIRKTREDLKNFIYESNLG